MKLGLRARSALALAIGVCIVIVLALVLGGQALDGIEQNLGQAFARNATDNSKLRVLAPVEKELALARRLAESESTRRFLLHENDADARAMFFTEAERFRAAFSSHSYFVGSGLSRNYWYNDDRGPFSDQPRYVFNPELMTYAWFFNMLADPAPFNINVDPDPDLGVVNVWLNVVVHDIDGRAIGAAGTGLDLTGFIHHLTSSAPDGVTPMLLGRDGSLQAHPDQKLIAFSTVNDAGARHSSVFDLLNLPADRERVRAALDLAVADPDSIQLLPLRFQGRDQLFSVSFAPELNWFVASAVDLHRAQMLDDRLWLPLVLGGLLLLAGLLAGISFSVDRLVIAPILKLTASARAIELGQYTVELPRAGDDEIGALTRAFGAMVRQVRAHTDELEARVAERTAELVEVNQRMAVANRKLGDSIEYASLIQNAILPAQEIAHALSERSFVLWKPRDVVGGDFYVFRQEGQGFLIGVIDCAGHGVPGALMTMIAHTAINIAIDTLGISDPAALLSQLDQRVSAMLPSGAGASQIATRMDAGLVYVDRTRRRLRFAGAKTSLYWCDGEQVGELKGDRRALGDRRRQPADAVEMGLESNLSFYLTTDGLLDQAGGARGFSFGASRFAEMLKRHAALAPEAQRHAFAEEIERYRGELPQRDDITVISFRFEEPR